MSNPTESSVVRGAAGLIKSAAHAFTTRTRTRGEDYLTNGAVRIEGADPQTVVTTVRGSRDKPYVCAVDFSQVETRTKLQVECTCPHFFEGHMCKHLYGSLLAIEAAGIELVPAAALDTRLDVVSYEANLSVEDDWFFTGEHAAPLTRADQRPDWERRLTTLRRSAGNWRGMSNVELAIERSRPRPVRYRLEVEKSSSLQGLVVAAYETVPTEEVPVPVALVMRDVPTFSSAEDRRLLSMLVANPMAVARAPEPGLRAAGDDAPSASLVPSGFHETVLRALVNSGRFEYVRGGVATPMVFDDGPAFELATAIVEEEVDGEPSLTLQARIVREGASHPIEDVTLVLRSGFVVVHGRIARWGPTSAYDFVRHLMDGESIRLSVSDLVPFLEALVEVPNLPALELPDPWKSRRGEPSGRVAFLEPDKRGRTTRGLVTFDYGKQRYDSGATESGWVDEEGRTVVRRDRSLEAALLERLGTLGVVAAPGFEEHQVEIETTALPSVARGLLDRGFHVEAKGRRLLSLTGSDVRLESSEDWFDLAGTFEFGEHTVELPELLRAIRDRSGFVKLSDGSDGMLPEEWLVRYGALDRIGTRKQKKLRFASSQAVLLDLLLLERETQFDERFQSVRSRLRNADGFRSRREARSFDGELREYQREGLGWLYFLQRTGLGGCLADDMGLGKTVQVLALLEARRRLRHRIGRPEHPSLVIAPRSLVHNWMAEAARFTPQLRVANYTGPDRWQYKDGFGDVDVVISTYGTVRRDVEILSARRFDYVVLDEAQAIKNASSLASKACRLLQADHRLALSGTPVENHLLELWSIFEFLNPKMLGSRREFARLVKDEDGRGLQIIARGLRPMILRRKKDQVLAELPAKTELTLFVEPDEEEIELYAELKKHYRQSLTKRIDEIGFDRARVHVLEALLRLRQAACHPGLLDDKRRKKDSAKIKMLLEQIREVTAEGHKALVFSQFVQLLTIVRGRLDKEKVNYAYLDGSTTKREEVVRKFQEDENCEVFLISLKAGGFGLNLTAADYVFILDPWWNPAVEAQAIDRAHRIGQNNPVFAYRLITRGSVEEKILELHKKKRALADAVIGEANHLTGALTLEDLELLLT